MRDGRKTVIDIGMSLNGEFVVVWWHKLADEWVPRNKRNPSLAYLARAQRIQYKLIEKGQSPDESLLEQPNQASA